MQTQQHHHHSHHGCNEGQSGGGRGPAWFYGYCHDSGQMRMMDYPDYVNNMQMSMSKMAGMYSGMVPQSAGTAMQPYMDMLHGHGGHTHHHKDCGCGGGCHEAKDCHCTCCIRCADAVEYARCGELRRIPITFDNDTRREKNVTLQLGNFATDSGVDPGWKAELSETTFTLAPCGSKTVLLSVAITCASIGTQPTPPAGTQPGGTQPTGAPPSDVNVPPTRVATPGTVDSCKVAYATLRAEGCTIRPLVIAVAVLPNDCGAHPVGCGCGCCGCN